tara:strand:- start:3421 stop:4065 length:645 start_codon:yes stop_codon:yes gene_type:complete
MATTTIDLDTELSAVNSILGAIGQAPITTLGTVSETNNVEAYDNPEVAFIFNLLRDANVDTQAEGWHFNTELHVPFPPDGNKHIVYPSDVLSLDLHDNQAKRTMDLVRDENGFLYDKINHTNEFDSALDLDVLYLRPFESLPIVFRRYITYRASRVAATQLVANPQLVKLLGTQEQFARAALMEHECNQADHNMLGFPEGSSYQTYQPWRNLRR